MTWSAPVAGTYSIRVRVDDGQAYAEQNYLLAVQDALAYLDVQLNVTPAIVNPGDPILVSVTLLGEGVAPTLQLSVDGAVQPLDTNGQAHLVAAASGTHRLVVTVSGNKGSVG